MACRGARPVVTQLIADVASPTAIVAVLGAFWRLSSRLTYQDTLLSALRERIVRIENKIDSENAQMTAERIRRIRRR